MLAENANLSLNDVAWLQELGWPGHVSAKAPFDNVYTSHNHASEPVPSPSQMNQSSLQNALYTQSIAIMAPDRQVYARQDSDCSWTEADDQDEWFELLRQELQDFRQSQQATLFTLPLSARQRKQVHSMANLWGLSHMSIGDGGIKRVLVSKCALSANVVDGNALSRPWNPRGGAWWSGSLDPRLVLIHWISSNVCVQTCLSVLDLPVPVNVTMDVRGDYGTAYALFSSSADAANVILGLNRSRPSWNNTSVDRELECSFLRFPTGFVLTHDLLLDHFYQLPLLLYQAFNMSSNLNPNQPSSRPPSRAAGAPNASIPALRNKPSTHSLSAIDERQALIDLADQLQQFPPLSHSGTSSYDASRRHSRTSSQSRDLGYTSASSQVDSDYSHATSLSKKRKREPMIPNGYKCSIDGCDKAFDHDGERRKHERNHSGERPYACRRCGKGFLYPKDLRRHARTHLGSAQASPTLERVSDASDVDEIDIGASASVVTPSNQHPFGTILPMHVIPSMNEDRAIHPRHGFGRFSSKIADIFGNGRQSMKRPGVP
ncbi:hypothetical protein AC579_10252 [Pseudocercospora musae]|uniref:C2H2 type master regulator of conidiophore development brlA n=1 Tax=Pseudocercospora musae TaxID=113226 RepID=A0A139HDQ3_9PEZI|nr:hypothetical protein AC579_10252 [Pseudocercospora musae]